MLGGAIRFALASRCGYTQRRELLRTRTYIEELGRYRVAYPETSSKATLRCEWRQNIDRDMVEKTQTGALEFGAGQMRKKERLARWILFYSALPHEQGVWHVVDR